MCSDLPRGCVKQSGVWGCGGGAGGRRGRGVSGGLRFDAGVCEMRIGLREELESVEIMMWRETGGQRNPLPGTMEEHLTAYAHTHTQTPSHAHI